MQHQWTSTKLLEIIKYQWKNVELILVIVFENKININKSLFFLLFTLFLWKKYNKIRLFSDPQFMHTNIMVQLIYIYILLKLYNIELTKFINTLMVFLELA